jgi:hypothetical protein
LIEIKIESGQEPILSDPQLPAWFKSGREGGFPSIIEKDLDSIEAWQVWNKFAIQKRGERSLYSLTLSCRPGSSQEGRKIEIKIEAYQEPVLSDPQLPAWFKSGWEGGFPSIIVIRLGSNRDVAGACTLWLPAVGLVQVRKGGRVSVHNCYEIVI